jgi:hypothetical protein
VRKPKRNTEAEVLAFLLKGGRHTAKEIHFQTHFADQVWETLIRLEREGLVYRAYMLDDWTTFQKWKITGCGALQSHLPI